MGSGNADVGEGQSAPEFSLISQDGQRVSLKAFKGKKTVVLYFYPKDNTPGCTQEACDFRDLDSKITRGGAVTIGISLDPVSTHRRFSEKYALPFPILSDEDAKVSKKYGVYKKKQLYGRTFWGIERSTFVIDRRGKILKAFRKVKVKGHAEEIVRLLRPPKGPSYPS